MEENQLPECCCEVTIFKKDLKTRIQEKLNERIENILSKSELTDDDFRILESRLLSMRTEEMAEKAMKQLDGNCLDMKEA